MEFWFSLLTRIFKSRSQSQKQGQNQGQKALMGFSAEEILLWCSSGAVIHLTSASTKSPKPKKAQTFTSVPINYKKTLTHALAFALVCARPALVCGQKALDLDDP